MRITRSLKRITATLCLILLLSPAYASQKVEVESLRLGVVVSNVSVAQTATALPVTALKGRKTILITNNTDEKLYLGDSSVATNTGLPIELGQTFAADITENIVIYGIVASGTSDIRVMELR